MIVVTLYMYKWLVLSKIKTHWTLHECSRKEKKRKINYWNAQNWYFIVHVPLSMKWLSYMLLSPWWSPQWRNWLHVGLVIRRSRFEPCCWRKMNRYVFDGKEIKEGLLTWVGLGFSHKRNAVANSVGAWLQVKIWSVDENITDILPVISNKHIILSSTTTHQW